MLPGGVLSKHGYTRKWGFFNGVCAGAGHAPFEQSKDLIAGAIKNIEAQIKEVSAQIAELENFDSKINGQETAKRRLYSSYLGYYWADVKVVEFETKNLHANEPGSEPLFYYNAKTLESKEGAKPERLETYDASWKLSSVRHFVHFLNSKYAKEELRKQNASRRDWIKWQTGRLANWTPKPLTERGQK